MTNKTKQIEKAFEKLMTDMGATFVDVTPEKKQTDHNPDIVKKVDWDERIEAMKAKYRKKATELFYSNYPEVPKWDMLQNECIKQLLFEYGEELRNSINDVFTYDMAIDKWDHAEMVRSVPEPTYRRIITPEEQRIIDKIVNQQEQKNKEVLE